jgi:hypothetical protein
MGIELDKKETASLEEAMMNLLERKELLAQAEVMQAILELGKNRLKLSK